MTNELANMAYIIPTRVLTRYSWATVQDLQTGQTTLKGSCVDGLYRLPAPTPSVHNARFSLKDLGCLNYFLGVEVIPSTTGIFLSQRKYITDLLHKSGVADTKPASSPLSAMDKLLQDSAALIPSPTEY
jgi:hypothetical protein